MIRYCGHQKLILHVGIPDAKPNPHSGMSFEEVIESNHYESDEE